MDPIINDCYATAKYRTKFTEEDVQRLASFLESDIKFENLDDETRKYWTESCQLLLNQKLGKFFQFISEILYPEKG